MPDGVSKLYSCWEKKMKQFYIKNDALGLGGVSWPQNRCCAQADEPLACALSLGTVAIFLS